MSYRIVKEFPNDILYDREGVCISIYQPTHRYSEDRQQDKIVFKNNLQKIETSLAEDYSGKEIGEILAPLHELEKDPSFWNHTKDGIAIFLNERDCVIYNLNRDFKNLAIVSDSFHIKPLIRVFQSADEYHVLGVNRQTFKLFSGNRYGLKEIEFDEEVNIDVEDVLGDQYTDSYLSHAAYGGAGRTTMYHGHGSKKDEIDKDIARYFRYVDRFVMDNYSKPSKSPLVLAALEEYQGSFRKISHNRWLLDKGISKDFEALSLEDLEQESWDIVEDIYLERTRVLVDRFETARARDLGSDEVEDIARKATENRIEMMLIESDRILPGKIDLQTGEIEEGDLSQLDTDDLFDDLTEMVLMSGGEVVMLPEERMPTDTGVAAVYRY